MPERVVVDIPCDPMQIDQTGRPWAFLDEAAELERIVEGAIVVTGDANDPVFAGVASLTERPSGTSQIQRMVIAKNLFR